MIQLLIAGETALLQELIFKGKNPFAKSTTSKSSDGMKPF